MVNESNDRKSLALDRAAHRWLTEAAEKADLSVKEALEDAIRFWARVTSAEDVTPKELIEGAVLLRKAERWLEQTSISITPPGLSDDMAAILEASGPSETIDDIETQQFVEIEGELVTVEEAEEKFEPWQWIDLYSFDWERSEHTAAKVGPDAFEIVDEIADETDRSNKRCVEEAVQLWCILQNEYRAKRASRKARKALEILREI